MRQRPRSLPPSPIQQQHLDGPALPNTVPYHRPCFVLHPQLSTAAARPASRPNAGSLLPQAARSSALPRDCPAGGSPRAPSSFFPLQLLSTFFSAACEELGWRLAAPDPRVELAVPRQPPLSGLCMSGLCTYITYFTYIYI